MSAGFIPFDSRDRVAWDVFVLPPPAPDPPVAPANLVARAPLLSLATDPSHATSAWRSALSTCLRLLDGDRRLLQLPLLAVALS